MAALPSVETTGRLHQAVAAFALVAVTSLGTAGQVSASASRLGPSRAATSVATPGLATPGLVKPRPAAVSPAAGRFNVGATHSPQLERELAGHQAVPPRNLRTRPASLPASASTVQGIDVASGQHPGGAAIDWSEVAAAGYKFAFIKATEGSYYANPYYATDAAGAEAAGLFVAPYAFVIPNYSGGALQADYALDNSPYTPDGHTLPLILDVEYNPYVSIDHTNQCYGMTPARLVAWISAFSAEADRRTGQLPVIYTTAQWWTACTADSTAFDADTLWIASPGSSPSLPASWNDWTYWQYTTSATVPGIAVATDASYLSSTALELAAPADQSDQAGGRANLQLNSLDGGQAVSYSGTGLPSGLSVNAATGVIGGPLPARPTAFRIAVTAAATSDPSATARFTWDVHGKVSLGRLRDRSGSVGAPVLVRIGASDALPGCTLRFAAAGLPPGLRISTCGLISGWPLRSGSYRVQVQVSDSSGTVLAQGAFGWTMNAATGSGPAGQIRLSRDGKCLDELSLTDIAISTCNSGRAQRWTIAADGTLRISGRCLAAGPASKSRPASLALASCRHGVQRWQQDSDAVLKNLTDGRCLADTGTRDSARAVAATCIATPNNTGSASTPSPNQQWTLPAGPLVSGVAGLCATGTAIGGCPGTSRQAWTIEPDGTIRAGGQCLGLDQGHTAPGTQVRLGRCKRSMAQIWQLVGGPMGVELLSPVAGLCLADPRDAAATGTRLVVAGCVTGDPGISWRVS